MNKNLKKKYNALIIADIFAAIVMEYLSYMTINSLLVFFDKSKLLLIPTLIPITAVITKVFSSDIKKEKRRLQKAELLTNDFVEENISIEKEKVTSEAKKVTNNFSYKYDGHPLERIEKTINITKTKKMV